MRGGVLAVGSLRTDEAEAAVALWNEATLTRPWNDPHADLALAMGKPASDVLAGRFGGVLVATAMVGHDGHRGWADYLAVGGPHRDNGFGAAMIAACEHAIRYAGSDVTVMAKVL